MDLNTQLTEYHAIQAWLRGTKPAPAGRTWRRTLVAAALMPVPAPVERYVAPGLEVALELVPFLLGWGLLTVGPHLVELLLPPDTGMSGLPFVPFMKEAGAAGATIAGTILMVSATFRAVRLVFGR